MKLKYIYYIVAVFLIAAVLSSIQAITVPWSWGMSSDFGPRGYSGWDFHEGIDYSAIKDNDDLGMPIPAVEGGNIQEIVLSGFCNIEIKGSATSDVWFYGHIFRAGVLSINEYGSNRVWEGLENAKLANPIKETDIVTAPIIILWTNSTKTQALKILCEIGQAGRWVKIGTNPDGTAKYINGSDGNPKKTQGSVSAGEYIAPMGDAAASNVHLHLGLNYPNDNPLRHLSHPHGEYSISTEFPKKLTFSEIKDEIPIKILLNTVGRPDLDKVVIKLDEEPFPDYCYGGETGVEPTDNALSATGETEGDITCKVEPQSSSGIDYFTIAGYDFSKLDYGEHILKTDAYEVDGTYSKSFEHKFTILPCPQVSSTAPTDKAENVGVNSEIKITFDSDMEKCTVEGAVSIVPDFTKEFTWDTDASNTAGKVLTIKPTNKEEDLKYCTEYAITITDAARGYIEDKPWQGPLLDGDGDGKEGGNYEFKFTTEKPNFEITIDPPFADVGEDESATHTITVTGANAKEADGQINAYGSGGDGWSVSGLPINEEFSIAEDSKNWSYSVTNNGATDDYVTTAGVSSKCSRAEGDNYVWAGGPAHATDHPDETVTVPVKNYPTPYCYDKYSKTGVLLNGWGMGIATMLGKFKVPVCGVKKDLHIVGAADRDFNDLKVLIIPSAGLRGLENSSIFKERLAYFVQNGGTVICMTQPKGEEWQALPVPAGDALEGYGWEQDQSCFNNACYISNYDVVCAGQASVNFTGNADGYISQWPDSAKVILSRTKNCMPDLIKYSYGDGQVMVSGLYSDWGYGHGTATPAEFALLWDMVAWAKDANKIIPEYKPNTAITLPVKIINNCSQEASIVRLYIVKPQRIGVDSIEITQTIISGDSATINWTSPGKGNLGIWLINYSLVARDSNGNKKVVQTEVDGERFAVSNNIASTNQTAITHSITSTSENFAVGGGGKFTYHVWNNTDQERTITVKYCFPYHCRATGNAMLYGDFDASYDTKYWLSKSITVPAHDHNSFDYVIPIVKTKYGMDLARSIIFDESDNEISRAYYSMYVHEPKEIAATVATDKIDYSRLDSVKILLMLGNNTPAVFPLKAIININDPENETLFVDSISVDLSPNATFYDTLYYHIQPEAKRGINSLTAQISYNNEILFYTTNYFNVLSNSFSVRPQMPAMFVVGNNEVSFVVKNLYANQIATDTLRASIVTPAGVIVWQADTTFCNMTIGEERTIAFAATLPDPYLGEYKLRYRINSEKECQGIISNKLVPTAVLDKTLYKIRETANATFTICNPGMFDLSGINYTIKDEADAVFASGTVNVLHGDSAIIPVAFTVPQEYCAGQHLLKAGYTLQSGSEVQTEISYMIPAQSFEIKITDSCFIAGDSIPVIIKNIGGVDAQCSGYLGLFDPAWNTVADISQVFVISPGDSAILVLPVSAQLPSGKYYIWSDAYDQVIYNRNSIYITASIEGIKAGIVAVTDKNMYLSMDDIIAETEINNNGPDITDANLHLAVTTGSNKEEKAWLSADWWPYYMNEVKATPTAIALKDSLRHKKYLDLGTMSAPMGTFNDAIGIEADGDGHVYVVDDVNYRVQRFDEINYGFDLMWGHLSHIDGGFDWPWALTLDKSGNVYVVDACDYMVKKYDHQGNFILKWGGQGTGNGKFEWPEDVAVDQSGFIYVTDTDNNNIQKFDSLGNFILKWEGIEDPTYTHSHGPNCIAIDKNGFVYTGDYSGYVQKFDTLGNFIAKWRTSYDNPYSTVRNQPDGIAVDNNGNVYVREAYVETDNNSWLGRIIKFDDQGNFIAKWAEYGYGVGELRNQGHITVGKNGDVYATNYEEIFKYDSNGNYISTIGSYGTVWDMEPSGIACDSLEGNIFISSSSYYSFIAKYDKDGSFLKKWGSMGTNDGQFIYPSDVSLNALDRVYVVDAGNNRIQVFDPDGNYMFKWGTYGSGSGQFNAPQKIAIDKDGYLYITDWRNHRVQKFDKDGNFILKWGTNGSGNGQFSGPGGITIDEYGYVYVVDCGNRRVQKFDANGLYISKWGSSGIGDGQFSWPYGIAYDIKSAYIYVMDVEADRIQWFDKSGNFINKYVGEYPNIYGPIDLEFNINNDLMLLDYFPRIQFLNNSYANSGNCITYPAETEQTVPFGTINWQGKQPPGTNIKFRVKVASEAWALDNVSWSDYYTVSGSPLNFPVGKGIQLELTMETQDPTITPELNKVWVTYGNQGEIVWEMDSTVSLPCSLSAVNTNYAGNLGRTGKFYLTGQLTSQTGQTIAKSEDHPFNIAASDIGLLVNADKPYYHSNDSMKITGLVKNLSNADATDLTLTVRSDSLGIYAETFDLAQGEEHQFNIDKTIASSFMLNAELAKNDNILDQSEEYIQIINPRMDQCWLWPMYETVNADSFPVFLEMYNIGPVDAHVNVDFGGINLADTIGVNQFKTITRYFAVAQDSIITAQIRGDASNDLSCNVYFGAKGWVGVAANSLYPEGSLEIPYTVYSTGELPVNMDVNFVLYDQGQNIVQNITRQFYLPGYDSTVDKLNFNLPEGQYLLEYTANYSGKPIELYRGQAAFRVGKYNRVVIDTIIVCSDTCAADGAMTGFAVVTNTGANQFDGRLNLDLGFWSYDSSLILGIDQSDTIEFKTYSIMPAGNYAAKGQVLYSGWGIDSLTVPFNLKPDIYFVNYPQYISADAGNAGQVHTVARNRGTAYGQDRLQFNCGDIADAGQNLFLRPGELSNDTLRFYPEEDLEDKDYPAVLTLGSIEKDVILHVNGCKLDVAVTFDQPAYYEGDSAGVLVNIVNRAKRADRYNTVLTYNEQQYKLDFAAGWLDAVDAVNLPGDLSLQLLPEDTTLPQNLWTFSYPDSGIWVSQAYPVLAEGTQPVNWVSQEPLNTGLSVAARYSTDGFGWDDWNDLANGGSFDIPDAGYYQLKFVLRSQDKYSTPALSELQFNDHNITTLDDFRSDSVKLSFNVPVHHTGQKLWAGVYSMGGRSVYLNSYYLRELKDSFNLYSDKDMYNSGEEMQLTAQTTVNGTLTWNIIRGISPAISGQSEITAPASGFTVQLPEDAVSGPSVLNYVFNPAEDTTREITGEAAFDINGYIGRIWECTLDKTSYAPGEPMNVRYKLEFNRPGSYRVKGWLKDRERNYIDAFDMTQDYNQGVSTIIIPDTMSLAVSGMGELIFAVYKPLSDGGKLLLASGSESFDVMVPDSIPPQVLSLTAIPSIFKPTLSEVTNITVTVTEACNWVKLDIRDQIGNTLKNYYYQDAGNSAINMTWDGKDKNGSQVPGGLYNIVAYACDYAGNLSNQAQTSVEVVLDNIPPVTTLNFGQPNYGTAPVFVNSNTELSLTAGDDISGVSSIQYALDDTTQFTIYNSHFTIPSAGPHIIYYRSTDNAGNIEDIKALAVSLDNDAPQISLTTDPAGIVKDDGLIVSSQTMVGLAADDNLGCGVKQLQYSLDDGQLAAYEAPISLGTLSEGSHKLVMLAEDNLGNVSQQERRLYIDATGPALAVDIGDPKIPNNGIVNVTSNTGILVTTSDTLAGVKTIQYRVNGGDWMPYVSQLNISGNDGAYGLEFSAIDSLGNISSAEVSLVLDNTGPAVSSILGDPKYQAGSTYITSNTGISLNAVDATGVDSLSFAVDGSGWQPYSGAFYLPTEGQHQVSWQARDLLGNYGTQGDLTLLVDNTGPVNGTDISSPKVISSGKVYVNSSAAVTLRAQDLPETLASGIGWQKYQLSGQDWQNYILPFNISGVDGEYKISASSGDNLGNISSVADTAVWLDNTAPATTVNVGTPKYLSGSLVYVTSGTGIDISVSDAGCGVGLAKYNLGEGLWTAYPSSVSLNLTGEGLHAIITRSYDLLNNSEPEESLALVLDNIAPTSSLIIESPKYETVGAVYITSASSVMLSAEDVISNGTASGVKNIQYRINQGAWADYNAAISIAGADGQYIVEYRASDNLGNLEAVQAKTVVLDNATPVTQINIGLPKYGSAPAYINTMTPIGLSCADSDGSGLLNAEYRIDDGNWTSYTGSVEFTIGSEGLHTISYRSQDQLGNVEEVKELMVAVDNTAPLSSMDMGLPKAETAGNTYLTSVTPISIASLDPLSTQVASGVDSLYWELNGNWHSSGDSVAQFSLNGPDGIYTIGYKATDHVRNSEAIKSGSAYLDNTAPVTTVTVGIPKYPSGNMVYVTSGTGIDISVTDAGCGVGLAEYGLDGGGWTPYIGSKTFNIATEGIHQLTWRSNDKLGNQEDQGSASLAVDNTPPVSLLEVGDPKCEALGKTYVTSGSTIIITGTDPLSGNVASGIKTVEYRINGSAWTVYDSPLVLTGFDGQYLVEYRSTDNVGNAEDTRSVTVYLDNTAPSTTVSVGDPQYLANGSTYVTSGTPIYVSASDQGCGVQSSEYRIDGGIWIAFNSATPINAGTEGRHTISWRSIDKLGNVETEASIILNVDNTHTISQLDLGQPQYIYSSSDSTLITSNTALTLWAYDPISADVASGTGKVEYRINKGPWITTQDSSTTFNLTGMDGQDTVDYRSADHLNNLEPVKTKLLVLDNTPPMVNITSPAGLIFVNGTIKVTGTAADLHFGVYWLEYGSGSSPSSWTKIGTDHTSPVVSGLLETWDMTTLPQGYYTIKLAGRDLVGNMAEDRVTVFVGQPEFAFEINDFNKCEGVALDRIGNIYVADRNASENVGHNRVAKFDPFGTLLLNIFDFNKPNGVDVDGFGNIFTTEWAGRSVGKYSPEGQLLLNICGFGQPNGIVVDKQGYIFVADQTDCSINKFDSLGNKVMRIAGVDHPDGVALDSLGNIYSTETEQAHLVKFDPQGDLIWRYGAYGLLPGQFDQPADVEIDKYQNIWVVDRNNDRVQVFDPEFNLLGILGAMGHDAGQFNKPEGIALSDVLDIFVADRDNDRVQKFTIPSEPEFARKSLMFGVADSLAPLKIEQAINWPNPFNPTREATRIRVVINKNATANIKIYALTGRMVKDMSSEVISGINELEWDGRNNLGELVNNGVYNYVVTATAGSEKATAQGKIVVMK